MWISTLIKVMPNLFIETANAPKGEDFFTASLAYLLNCVPNLGQSFVNVLFSSGKKVSPTFLRAVDHPPCNSTARLDLKLECEEMDIFCEHKLESPLSQNQLEKYLAFAKNDALQSNRPKKLVLITRKSQNIQPSVLQDQMYLRPYWDQYYQWQDFYDVIVSSEHNLAQEFAEYMCSLGVKPQGKKSFEFQRGLADSGGFDVDLKQLQTDLIHQLESSNENLNVIAFPKSYFGFESYLKFPGLEEDLLRYGVIRSNVKGLKSQHLQPPYFAVSLWIPENNRLPHNFTHLSHQEILLDPETPVVFKTGRSCHQIESHNAALIKCVATFYTKLSTVQDTRQEVSFILVSEFIANVCKYVQKMCIQS
jgi:hypothetical protein